AARAALGARAVTVVTAGYWPALAGPAASAVPAASGEWEPMAAQVARAANQTWPAARPVLPLSRAVRVAPAALAALEARA
ncbi:hypothetical protein PJI17_32775, partial [Mycobacterium kansasii]